MNYFWLVVLPNLDSFLGCLGLVGLCVSAIGLLVSLHQKIEACSKNEEEQALKLSKTMLKVLSVSIGLFFITCFMPTKKDFILLKTIAITSELKGIEQIPQSLVDKINELLVSETG